MKQAWLFCGLLFGASAWAQFPTPPVTGVEPGPNDSHTNLFAGTNVPGVSNNPFFVGRTNLPPDAGGAPGLTNSMRGFTNSLPLPTNPETTPGTPNIPTLPGTTPTAPGVPPHAPQEVPGGSGIAPSAPPATPAVPAPPAPPAPPAAVAPTR